MHNLTGNCGCNDSRGCSRCCCLGVSRCQIECLLDLTSELQSTELVHVDSIATKPMFVLTGNPFPIKKRDTKSFSFRFENSVERSILYFDVSVLAIGKPHQRGALRLHFGIDLANCATKVFVTGVVIPGGNYNDVEVFGSACDDLIESTPLC